MYTTMNKLGLPEETISTIFTEARTVVKNAVKVVTPSTHNHSAEAKINNTLNNFTSKYRRQKLFSKNQYFTKPTQIPIGFRWELRFNHQQSRSYKKVLVQNLFQFIPISMTIKTIFKNNHFATSFKDFNTSHSCTEGLYTNMCCGAVFQALNSKYKFKNVVLIQLYYDDFEVAKVLGSKTLIHKIGAIYFTIVNCPLHLKSKLQNIFLVSLFFVNDLHGDFNLNTVLKPIIDDIKLLEVDGIIVENIGLINCALISLAHDNLAANDMLGFTKSFSANYFCRICTMTKSITKVTPTEDPELLRTSDCYDVLKNWPPEHGINLIETKGINRTSILNELLFFDTIKNYSVDLMHDGLEGFVPLTLKYLFEFLISKKILLNVQHLNDCVSSYNFGFIDRKSKPSNINLDRSNLGQNASQILCLAVHFPFIFDRFHHSSHDDYWRSIITMLQILTILFSYEITEGDIKNLQDLISQHLHIILNVFNKTLTPKQHFLIHYPRIIRQMGPIINMWTMRYEGKHRYFTKNVNPNFINICHTFAHRHQQMLATCWLQFGTELNYKTGKKSQITLPDSNYRNFQAPLYKLTYFENEFHYKKGFFILKEKFSIRETIHLYMIEEILENKNEIYFHLNEYIGIVDQFYCSFMLIKKNEDPVYILYKNLKYKKSYEAHCCYNTNNSYILSYNIHKI